MIILLWLFLAMMAVAVATTVFAILRARDGYQDEAGFHLTSSAAAPEVAGKSTMAECISEVAPARTGNAAADLPAGLLAAR